MLDLRQVDKAIEEAFEVTADTFADAQIRQIEAWVWEWPRETVRQNGQIVSSPRDIVDTGELRNSLVQSASESLKRDYIYRAGHAAEVHEGAGNKPARPWTERAAQEEPIAPIFAEEVRSRLD